MNDDKITKKAEDFRVVLHGMAEATVKTFEKYLNNHQDAPMQEKHDNLVSAIEAGFIASQLQLFAITI